VIGRRGQTIISMQRATGTKMHMDQYCDEHSRDGPTGNGQKRVGALLSIVSHSNGNGDSMITS
jgi:hypothetical protein